MTRTEDQGTRERIRTGLQECQLVEASAGTGKTHELVLRLVNLLASGVPVEQIVAVTFTRKAAGELKLRLRTALEQARQDPSRGPARAALEQALFQLEEARIGTIHSFCADLLRARPVEAQVDPDFRELDEAQARRLYDQAFARFMHARLSDPSPALDRALARKPAYDSRGPIARLADAGWELVRWRDYDAPWHDENLDLGAQLEHFADRLVELAELSQRGSSKADDLYQALAPVRDWVDWLQRAELDGGRVEHAMEARLLALLEPLGRAKPRKYGMYAEGLSRLDVIETADKLLLDLQGLKRRADAQLAVLLRTELQGAVQAYEHSKVQLGALDFEDLLLKVRGLLTDQPQVRQYLQGRFTHLLVDEFQDTDPLQTEILLLLSADDGEQDEWDKVRPRPGSLFLVGDPKQSIYRFRRADVVFYARVCEQLSKLGVPRLELSHSFRATREIQAAINVAFAPEMKADEPGAPRYVPLKGGLPTPKPQPALLTVPIAYPHGRYGVTGFAVNQQLPSAIGGFVQWLLQDSGWTVRDPKSGHDRVPVQPRHVALLFRRLTSGPRDLTRAYTSDFEGRGLRHLLVGSRSFKDRAEVDAMVAVCSAIEWPQDELSVLAALRGPIFALPDDLVLRHRSTTGRLDPLMHAPAGLTEDLQPVQDALHMLKALWMRRNERALSVTLTELLHQTRAHASFALRPAGPEVLANVQRVVDLARGFEAQGGLSFRGFVERLIEQTQRVRNHESPAFEEDAEGVRMMTVHAAKGLEFPVVILADIGSGNRAVTPSRWVDSKNARVGLRLMDCSPRELLDHQDEERYFEEAETVRLAYVAATRARDLLVLPGVGEGTGGLFRRGDPRKSWTAPLEKVFYPALQRYTRPDPAPDIVLAHNRTVIGLPDNNQRNRACINAGLHVGRAGGPGAVWLDPRQLPAAPAPRYGLVHERYLAKDEDGHATEGLQAYQQWAADRSAAQKKGRSEAVRLLLASATELQPQAPRAVQAVLLPRTKARPSGRRFGTLVHDILRDVGWTATAEDIEALAHLHARLLGASKPEAAAACLPVQAALQHELFERARKAARRHREYPVLYDTPEGHRVDGSIDLAFFEQGRWVVVDFKTDADPTLNRYKHVRQVNWYMTALSHIDGCEAQGYLLYL